MHHRSGGEDEIAFRAVYLPLRRFAAVVSPIGVDPDDLVQEAVARTLRRHSLAEVDDLLAYLRTVVYRLAVNEHRRAVNQRRAFRRVDSSGAVSASYPSDLAELLRLGSDERAACYLAHVEGNDYRTVSQILGCSEETARARASRGLRRLRLALGEAEVRDA